MVITNANVIDGISDEAVRRATVLVRERTIVSVGNTVPDVPGATVLDLKGKWLLPGLIDAHVHLSDLAAARAALASGVTTVRSGGSRQFLDIGIRELNRAGVADLPDVVTVGYPLARQLDEWFFVDFPALSNLMHGVDGEPNVRRVARALSERGVNAIKVLATERSGLPQADPRKRTLSDEELGALVAEARRGGIPVMAHAHGDEGAAAAIRAGAHSIEHGTFISDRTLALMKEHGTFLVPTLTVHARYQETGGPQASPVVAARARAMLPRARATTVSAWRMGVKVAAGSDNRYDDKYRLQDELAALVDAGIPPLDAIKSATALAAECLMISARTGSIGLGLEADLIVVERDPTADINALRDVLLVINSGQLVVNRLDR